jgi:hypothetical protein
MISTYFKGTVPGDTEVSSSNPLPVSLASDTDVIGATQDAGTYYTTVLGVSGAQVATTDNTLTAVTDAPTTGQKIVLDDLLISADAACNVLFEIETTGTDLFQIYFAGAGTIQFTPRGKLKLATVNKKLTSKASGSVNVKILCLYHSEA